MSAKPQTANKELRTLRKRRQENECGGECVGTGEASERVPGECPEKCTGHKFKDATIKEAKRIARLNAINYCQVLVGGPNCLCRDGKYTEEPITCKTVSVKVCNEEFNQCEWTIKYKYTGTCKETA